MRLELGRRTYEHACVRTALAACLLLVITGPAPGVNKAKVGVVESRRIKAYDLALEGFADTMARKGFETQFVRWVVDSDTMTAENLAAAVQQARPDLILALGTDAARLIKESRVKIPSIFSMVSEPGASGLLNAGNGDGTPMTGVSLDVPIAEQFASLLDVVPKAQRIGVIYNPDESQFIVDEARTTANSMNLGLVTCPVYSEAEVSQALSSMRPKIDALWLVSDRIVLTTQSLQFVFLFAFQTNLPLMGLSEHFVKMGALFAVGPDYKDIGMQSGEFAAQILGGRDPVDLPVASPRKVLLSLNLRTAEIIGLRIPDSVVKKAAAVY